MDEDLRELARAAARGEDGARARLLAARRRAGALDDERLLLAARAGCPDARRLLPSAPLDADELVYPPGQRTPAWPPGEALAAALAAARAALSCFEAGNPGEAGPRACVEEAARLDPERAAGKLLEAAKHMHLARDRRLLRDRATIDVALQGLLRAEQFLLRAARAERAEEPAGQRTLEAIVHALALTCGGERPAQRAVLSRWLLGM